MCLPAFQARHVAASASTDASVSGARGIPRGRPEGDTSFCVLSAKIMAVLLRLKCSAPEAFHHIGAGYGASCTRRWSASACRCGRALHFQAEVHLCLRVHLNSRPRSKHFPSSPTLPTCSSLPSPPSHSLRPAQRATKTPLTLPDIISLATASKAWRQHHGPTIIHTLLCALPTHLLLL